MLDQNIDTSDATGRLLFHMLAAIGQFETELRVERQADGIKKAKEKGVRFGRSPGLTPDQVIELKQRREDGELIKNLMRDYKLGKTAIYKYLAEGDRPIPEAG